MQIIKFQVEFMVDEITTENYQDFQRRFLTSQIRTALISAAEEMKDRNKFINGIKVNLIS